MSDTNAAAPAAPAPASNEMAIQPAASQPNPIGSQAPDAPPDAPKSGTEGRRDSIRKAFQRTVEPGPAKPKMGHNQPPGAMKKEKDAPPPPIDLKKRPDEQPRERGEHGHFAARQADANTAAEQQKPQAGQQLPLSSGRPAVKNPLPEHAPYREPPPRMAPHAQAEWHTAPESVRGEVHRMHSEFSKAYQRMNADVQEMNSIRPFHNMARQHGTTLQRALSNYVSMEDKLRRDPVGGLDLIINNLNLRTPATQENPEGQRITLADIAWHVLNQTPEQHKLLQSQNVQTAQSQQMAALMQHIAALEQQQKKMQYNRRFRQTRRGVDRFAETHPRLDELGRAIEQELRLGFNLDQAYARADRLYPATRAAQTRNPTAQTRASDRSIHGAPDGGAGASSANGAKRSSKPIGRRDAISNAIRRVQGAL